MRCERFHIEKPSNRHEINGYHDSLCDECLDHWERLEMSRFIR